MALEKGFVVNSHAGNMEGFYHTWRCKKFNQAPFWFGSYFYPLDKK